MRPRSLLQSIFTCRVSTTFLLIEAHPDSELGRAITDEQHWLCTWVENKAWQGFFLSMCFAYPHRRPATAPRRDEARRGEIPAPHFLSFPCVEIR
jgi:hypothetical protein